jgi:hypothetical protein
MKMNVRTNAFFHTHVHCSIIVDCDASPFQRGRPSWNDATTSEVRKYPRCLDPRLLPYTRRCRTSGPTMQSCDTLTCSCPRALCLSSWLISGASSANPVPNSSLPSSSTPSTRKLAILASPSTTMTSSVFTAENCGSRREKNNSEKSSRQAHCRLQTRAWAAPFVALTAPRRRRVGLTR